MNLSAISYLALLLVAIAPARAEEPELGWYDKAKNWVHDQARDVIHSNAGQAVFNRCEDFRPASWVRRGSEDAVEKIFTFEGNCPKANADSDVKSADFAKLCQEYNAGLSTRLRDESAPAGCKLAQFCAGFNLNKDVPVLGANLKAAEEVAWIDTAMETRMTQMENRCKEWKSFAHALVDGSKMAALPGGAAHLKRTRQNAVLIAQIQLDIDKLDTDERTRFRRTCPGNLKCAEAEAAKTIEYMKKKGYLNAAISKLLEQSPLLADPSIMEVPIKNVFMCRKTSDRACELSSDFDRALSKAALRAQVQVEHSLEKYDRMRGFASDWDHCERKETKAFVENDEEQRKRLDCSVNSEDLLADLLISSDPSKHKGYESLSRAGCSLENRLLKIKGTTILRDFAVNAALVAGSFGTSAALSGARAGSAMNGAIRMTAVAIDAAGVVYDAAAIGRTMAHCQNLRQLALTGVSETAAGEATNAYDECQSGLSDQIVISLIGAGTAGKGAIDALKNRSVATLDDVVKTEKKLENVGDVAVDDATKSVPPPKAVDDRTTAVENKRNQEAVKARRLAAKQRKAADKLAKQRKDIDETRQLADKHFSKGKNQPAAKPGGMQVPFENSEMPGVLIKVEKKEGNISAALKRKWEERNNRVEAHLRKRGFNLPKTLRVIEDGDQIVRVVEKVEGITLDQFKKSGQWRNYLNGEYPELRKSLSNLNAEQAELRRINQETLSYNVVDSRTGESVRETPVIKSYDPVSDAPLESAGGDFHDRNLMMKTYPDRRGCSQCVQITASVNVWDEATETFKTIEKEVFVNPNEAVTVVDY